MKVVVIGGANIDVCSKSTEKLVEKDSNIGEIEFALGGVGRNIAEDLSLLGADTSLLTAIADDSFGKVVSDNAMEQSISLLAEPFTDKGSRTGVYTYVSQCDGSLFVGVNDMKIMERISPELIRENANAMMFSDMIVIEANLREDTIKEVASLGVRLCADCVSVAKCRRLYDVLDKLSVIKCNRAEALALSGCSDVKDAIRFFASKGVRRGAVTLGEEGAMCFHLKKDGVHVMKIGNYVRDRIIDTNGCGDAFLAGYLVGLLRNKSSKDCLISGQAAASMNAESFSSVNRNMDFFGLREVAKLYRDNMTITEEVI